MILHVLQTLYQKCSKKHWTCPASALKDCTCYEILLFGLKFLKIGIILRFFLALIILKSCNQQLELSVVKCQN